MKKIIRTLIFIFSLSMISIISAFALPVAKKTNSSYTWKKIEDEWFLLDKSFEPISGWVSYENDIYYFDKDGVMKTGWLKFNGSWYYLEEDGKLAIDKWVDNYYVDADGEKTKTR